MDFFLKSVLVRTNPYKWEHWVYPEDNMVGGLQTFLITNNGQGYIRSIQNKRTIWGTKESDELLVQIILLSCELTIPIMNSSLNEGSSKRAWNLIPLRCVHTMPRGRMQHTAALLRGKSCLAYAANAIVST